MIRSLLPLLAACLLPCLAPPPLRADPSAADTLAGTATRVLLRKTWWTRAAGESASAGRYATRGFYGRYTIRATLGDRVVETEIRHLPGKSPTVIHLTLP